MNKNFICDELVKVNVADYEAEMFRVMMQPADIILFFTWMAYHNFGIQSCMLFQGRQVFIDKDCMGRFREMCDDLGINLHTEKQLQNLYKAKLANETPKSK